MTIRIDLNLHRPSRSLQRLLVLTALAAGTAALTACAPLIVGGAAVGSSMLALDRRTSGAQLEDAGIEVKTRRRIAEALGERVHVSVNAYNRVVLLTGEVPNEADKARITELAAGVENVRQVVNETAVQGISSFSTRSSDVFIATKIRATYVDARDLMSNAFSIVVERGEVYLMGRVTEREATRATELARSVSGVMKVVRVFEILSEDELANMLPRQAPKPSEPAASDSRPGRY